MILLNNGDKTTNTTSKAVTTYREKQIGKTLFRVTSIYKGKIELKKALEDLTVRKILQAENSTVRVGG